MKRKVLIVIYIILILIALKLGYNILINSILINKYDKGEYSEKQAKMLTYLNFPERYIANYNYGNILYQNAEYEQAIEKYKKSLNGFIPKSKECSIRINYALAICQTVSVDENDQSSIDDAIEEYESAIEILTQKGCANKDDNNGHSQKAEQLKKDIQEEIDRLKRLQKYDKNEENKKEDDNNQTKKDTDTIEEKIQNIKEEAIQEERKTESEFKSYGNYNYEGLQKNW